MLNKTQITGRLITPTTTKEESEKNSIIGSSKDVQYYSLIVKIPSGSITLIRCMIKGQENVEKWEKELKENDIIKVQGYLKNEEKDRQILVRVINWENQQQQFEELNDDECNRVRLSGKITEIKTNERDELENITPKTFSFKLSCSQKRWKTTNKEEDNFFCRINNKEEIITQLNLQKGDVVLVDGFLQTKKVINDFTKKIEGRISTIICQCIKVLDNINPMKDFYPLNAQIINIPITKIDFNKPKH